MKIDKINNNIYPLKSTSKVVRVENKMGKFCQIEFCYLFLMKSSIEKFIKYLQKLCWIKGTEQFGRNFFN